MAPFLSVGRIALISLAAALLIHIAMSGFVSRRLADPVVNAIRRLSREDQGALGPADPSYKDLNALLDRTFDRTTDLEDRLAEQRKTLSEAFFEMVLHGTVHKKDLPERVASELGMASASRFRVMLCRILVSDELTDQVEILSRSALYVRKTVEDSPRVRVFSARPDVVGFVVYETEDVDPAARIFDVSKRLARDTDPLEEVGILVTVGGEAHDILEIHRSYEEAQAVFDAVSEHEGLEIFWYDNVPSKDEGYVLSPATLMSLSQALRHGRKDEIELIFDHIRRVNLDRKRITPAAASLLIRELWVNLAKTVQRVGIGREHQGEPLLEEASGELPPVLAKGSPVERLLSLRGYYVRCSELVPSAQSDSEPELVRDAKRYLEENFSRTDISLAMLADLFGVTPSHLSRSFSSSERTSFHVFLTHVRIEKAKAIIAQDPSSASAVYTEVGYTNQSTFRRAFQSYVGTTPVKYARLRSQDVRSGHS
jgi:AraC-like DNA-binding protein